MLCLVSRSDLATTEVSYEFTFGLEEGNLRILMDENRPIVIDREKLHIWDVTCQFIVIAGRDSEDIKDRMQPIIAEIFGQDTDAEITCLYINNNFYVLPLCRGNIQYYVIGLDEKSYALLRNKGQLQFRSRQPGSDATAFILNLFWAKDQEELKQIAKPLIGRTTLTVGMTIGNEPSAN